ncbi:hypothetical protein TNIN_291611 [Trichonephila inaurata madagascariensis]|uniref:Uncharacterized protein n=1 Tax=Trichonephila inaurata madagascariensis TaxID=2747483 RepID=A0A8X7BSZ9_9ARAC|nr:hypothetical protein TNIN_291611 [Trichonephila inaurata madagascariensis]
MGSPEVRTGETTVRDEAGRTGGLERVGKFWTEEDWSESELDRRGDLVGGVGPSTEDCIGPGKRSAPRGGRPEGGGRPSHPGRHGGVRGPDPRSSVRDEGTWGRFGVGPTGLGPWVESGPPFGEFGGWTDEKFLDRGERLGPGENSGTGLGGGGDFGRERWRIGSTGIGPWDLDTRRGATWG